VHRLARGEQAPREPTRVAAHLFSTDAETFVAKPHLHEEVFGPVAIVVRGAGIEAATAVAACLPGQLTASLHAGPDDGPDARWLLPRLEARAGRVVFGGVPTGVAAAMHHGGPYPASTDAATTSVGAGAIRRFLRPVCYQDVPRWLLPVDLREAIAVDAMTATR
jgi:NADP-dependent aldehyde dehydrogenase